ncbi:MAG: Fur family transcriptional regulator [Eubacteriales bacterium]
MKTSIDSITDKLKEKNIKPSLQRIKILEYLADYPCHPTVDYIFNALQPEMPTLSKSTVYNTLKVLKDAQLVRDLTIEENEVHYEFRIKDHGHFQCEVCGIIYDFDVDIQSIVSDDLCNFKIREKNIYFKGICKQCLKEENHKSSL